MAAGDYYIFRHRGLYFIWHTAVSPLAPPISKLIDIPHSGSTTSGIPTPRRGGPCSSPRPSPTVKVASPPPNDPYAKWARATRAWLENLLAQHSHHVGKRPLETEHAGFSICAARVLPRPHAHAFEAALDARTFYVDGMPLFRLDRMPPRAALAQYVGRDAYGHVACARGTPLRFRYAWKVPPPPAAPRALRMYQRLFHDSGTQEAHRVLDMPAGRTVTHRDAARVRMLEVLVGNLVADAEHARLLRAQEKVPAPEDIPPPLAALLYGFVFVAAYPMAYCTSAYSVHKDIDIGDPEKLQWPRSNLCALVWTHLDDDHSLRVGVARLAQEVLQAETQDGELLVHGVLISGPHIVIVRISRGKSKIKGAPSTSGSLTTSCTHTPPLPFLPSWYANSPSTPGLAALARLCARPDADALPKLLRLSFPRGITTARYLLPGNGGFLLGKANRLARLPCAVLANIRAFLPDLCAQVTFAHLCVQTAELARGALDVPTVSAEGMQFTLLRPVGAPGMWHAAFEAVDDLGNEVEVWVGADVRRRDMLWKGRIRMLSFGCGTVWEDGVGVALDMFVPFAVMQSESLEKGMQKLMMKAAAEQDEEEEEDKEVENVIQVGKSLF
ncbi:hypothetical protein DENSPDRAFT_875157 [Dentipellis sp. KUC8613]|nr:hypothetical protein DENSPDRAFT_875157 [Dentipellis sp. KUC8613]